MGSQVIEERWMGFDSQSKGHQIFWLLKRTITVKHNVRFTHDGSNVVIAGADELEREYGGSDEKLATTADSAPRVQAPVPENESVQVKKKEGLP